MTKKYEFTGESKELDNWDGGTKVYQIKAVCSFGNVKEGTLGGWIGSSSSLSHDGNAWVGDNAVVTADSEVSGNAQVSGNAIVIKGSKVVDEAVVTGNARLCSAKVSGNAQISGNAEIFEDAEITGNAVVCDNGRVESYAYVYGDVVVCGTGQVRWDVGIGGKRVINDCTDKDMRELFYKMRDIEDLTYIVRYWALDGIPPYGLEYLKPDSTIAFKQAVEKFILGEKLGLAIGAFEMALDPCIESSVIERDRYCIPKVS